MTACLQHSFRQLCNAIFRAISPILKDDQPSPLSAVHQGAVWSCKLNNPGMLGVTGSADFSARLWDALTGDEKCVWHHKHIVRTVDFANDCHRVVTGGAI